MVKTSQQIPLFHDAPSLGIEGATYVADFITPAEEADLMREIENGVWTHEFSRRRQHFGMDYRQADSDKISPLPPWIDAVARRVVAAKLFARMPVQALVNEYLPGQGISAHKDYDPFDEVASLSLASGCLMEFARLKERTVKTIWLAPRSLIVLSGVARHQWTHAIRPRLHDVVEGEKRPRQRRLSLTLRTIANANC